MTLTFPILTGISPNANSLDGTKFVGCIQEGFLNKYVDNPTRGDITLDLVLGNEPGQVTGF